MIIHDHRLQQRLDKMTEIMVNGIGLQMLVLDCMTPDTFDRATEQLREIDEQLEIVREDFEDICLGQWPVTDPEY